MKSGTIPILLAASANLIGCCRAEEPRLYRVSFESVEITNKPIARELMLAPEKWRLTVDLFKNDELIGKLFDSNVQKRVYDISGDAKYPIAFGYLAVGDQPTVTV